MQVTLVTFVRGHIHYYFFYAHRKYLAHIWTGLLYIRNACSASEYYRISPPSLISLKNISYISKTRFTIRVSSSCMHCGDSHIGAPLIVVPTARLRVSSYTLGDTSSSIGLRAFSTPSLRNLGRVLCHRGISNTEKHNTISDFVLRCVTA